jgi:hypothetical protein
LYDRQSAGSHKFDGTKTEFTKAQAEALSGKLKEITVVLGAPEVCQFIEIEAEDEKQAAVAARVIVGAKEGEGELLVAKSTNLKKNTAR